MKSPLNTHTDIQLAKVGDQIICEPSLYPYYSRYLNNVQPGKTALKEGYPFDAAYNCLVVGGYLFHRPDVTDSVILKAAERQGFQVIPVKQGYASCSTLVVSDHGVITADDGMEKALLQCGIDVCKIVPGGIRLKNYPYGFIGGSGGRVGEGEMLFFGTVKEPNVLRFLKQHNKTPHFFPGTVEDFGGLVFLEENR